MTNSKDIDKFKEELGIKPKQEVTEIDFATVNETMERFNTAPVHPHYKRKNRNFYVSEQAFVGLQSIAAQHNLFINRGTTTGAPSVHELLECIGLGIYRVVRAEGAPQS